MGPATGPVPDGGGTIVAATEDAVEADGLGPARVAVDAGVSCEDVHAVSTSTAATAMIRRVMPGPTASDR